MLLLLLGHKSNEKYVDELKNNVPQDLINYRYLLHPTRLMIMKLLSGEFSLTSVEIKTVLNIPWGDFGSHTKSLEKYGYIEIKDKFSDDGSVRQNITITQEGQKEYTMLFQLLEEFVETKTPLDYILNVDSETLTKDELYPDD